MAQIDISNVVSVSVSGTVSATADVNTGNLAIFTDETPVVSLGGDDYALYKNATDVGVQWGTTSEVYKMAVAIFSQQPNILNTGGSLIVIPLLGSVSATSGTFTTSNISLHTDNFANITDGAIKVKKDAGSYVQYSSLSFGATPTLSSIASVLDAALNAAGVHVTVDGGTLVFTSSTTGAASAIAIQAPASGTDITSAIFLDITNGTAVQGTAGGGVETVEDAILRTKDLVFYMGILSAVDITSEIGSIDDYVQTLDKLLYFSSEDTAELETSSNFDDVRSAGNYNTRCIFYSESESEARQVAAAYASKGQSVNFSGSNTTTTQHLKTLNSITGDSGMTESRLTKALAVGADSYPVCSNKSVIFSSGANNFFDDVFNLLWFKISLENTLFNALAATGTKIPQTEEGMAFLKAEIKTLCELAKNNRFIGAGTWTSSDTFGNQDDFIRNIAEVGYYIYSSPISAQSSADRLARKAPPIQIALKYQGAVHSANIIININK